MNLYLLLIQLFFQIRQINLYNPNFKKVIHSVNLEQYKMDKAEQQVEQIIEHKITKVNGEIGFKRYQRGKMLGKGGFAKCYQGVNLQTKKLYAIKVIDKTTLQKNRAKQKLLSEIKIHKTLHQDYIVEFDSVFQDSKFVYIILELCKNKTLSEMVKKRKKLTVKQTRYFMHQLVSAVQYMHSNRVIHRDLKLGNIFLNDNMEIKVGDFGLATKLQFADQKKRTMCGTPNYIAPQIVEGSVGHSYEVDIWSTGVICFAFLFGRPPFQTNEVKMTYKKIKNCEYNFPNTSVPEDAKDFIKKILVLDPKARLTTKQMLCHPFMTNQDIPKTLTAEALVSIPSFKSNDENQNAPTLSKVRSIERLRPQDFGKKKLELNKSPSILESKSPAAKVTQGLLSPRNIFASNELERQPSKIIPLQASIIDKKDEHKIHILTYVDYSKKYGLGYIINNKIYGVYFNDETLMSSDEKKERIYFIKNPTAKQQKIEEYTQDNIPKQRDFQKKYLLLDRFITHLNDELAKMESNKVVYEPFQKFVYMKQWLKTRHAIMFGLSNKLFQVNFFDNSQILLQTQKKTVLFTSKRGEATYQTLSNVLTSQENEMTRRITYTKQILNSIRKKKQDGGDQGDIIQ